MGDSNKAQHQFTLGRDDVLRIGDATVSIVTILHDKVRLGVDAPLGHTVQRSEVYELLQRCRAESEGRPQPPAGQ